MRQRRAAQGAAPSPHTCSPARTCRAGGARKTHPVVWRVGIARVDAIAPLVKVFGSVLGHRYLACIRIVSAAGRKEFAPRNSATRAAARPRARRSSRADTRPPRYCSVSRGYGAGDAPAVRARRLRRHTAFRGRGHHSSTPFFLHARRRHSRRTPHAARPTMRNWQYGAAAGQRSADARARARRTDAWRCSSASLLLVQSNGASFTLVAVLKLRNGKVIVSVQGVTTVP